MFLVVREAEKEKKAEEEAKKKARKEIFSKVKRFFSNLVTEDK